MGTTDVPEIPDELVDQLLEGRDPADLTGPDGLLNQLRRRLIERAAGAELSSHLGYGPGDRPPGGQANRRNGASRKTLRTVDGPLTVDIPRDRSGDFEPRVVPKHVRSFDGFDDQILALYAGGMTTREIRRHLQDLYGVGVSEGLISEVTASIQDDVRAWQSRPLEELYVVVYLDAMMVSIDRACGTGDRRYEDEQGDGYHEWRDACLGEGGNGHGHTLNLDAEDARSRASRPLPERIVSSH